MYEQPVLSWKVAGLLLGLLLILAILFKTQWLKAGLLDLRAQGTPFLELRQGLLRCLM